MIIAAIIIGIFIIACIGGWLSRMCGGGPPKLPYGMDQWIYALPYFVISLPATAVIWALTNEDPKSRHYFKLIALLPYTGAVAGKRTGHGGGIDAGTSQKVRDDEALEFLIKPLHGKIPEYWYDMLLLAVTGLSVTLLSGMVVCFSSIPAGLLIIVSGAFKAPAYMIGWAIYPTGSGTGIPHLNEATAIGEFLTGFFAYACLSIAFFII